MRRTPLYDEHVRAGARMVEFADWLMPVHYGSIIDEHRQVRAAAGLFDVSHMGEIEISGPRAEECCRRLLANDAGRLVPGRAQYSLIQNARGGVVDDVIVYRLGGDRFLLCVNAVNADTDLEWLREHAPTGCRIEDQSDVWALLALQGPGAADALRPLAPATAAMRRFAFVQCELGSITAMVARTGYTGEDGFELFVPAERSVELWRDLLAAGDSGGVGPAGLGARDTLRLEAALPLYGHEIDQDTSPYEVGLDWVVKLDRSEMIGFEALRKARDGGVRRHLVGLEVSGGIAREGCAVVACGARIGKVTSGSYCPSLDEALALALVDRQAPLREMGVEIRGKVRPARVTRLPFYVSGTHKGRAS